MRPLLDTLGSVATWSTIAQLLFQISVLGALGHLALLLARRGSAALRHMIALAALAALPALLLLGALPTPWGPWRVPAPLMPAPREEAPAPPLHRETFDEVTTASLPPASDEIETAPRLWLSSPSRPASPPLFTRENLPAWLAGLAAAVSGLLLLRLAFGLFASAWAVRRAARLPDERLVRAHEVARRRLAIDRPVRLAIAPGLGIPVVTGLLRPALVLPAEARGWTDERLQSVLLHELAHVRRRDAVSLMIGRVATALFWFHPASWTLARVMRRECERACDDVVLASGLRASDYASHLLAIARGAAGRRIPGLTLAFARTSSLEGRLLSVLRADLRRGPTSRGARVAAVLVALLVLTPLSAVRLVGAAIVVGEEPATLETHGIDVKPVWSPTKPEAKTEFHEQQTQLTRQETRQETSFESSDDESSALAEPAGTQSGAELYQRGKSLYETERFQQAGQAYEEAARAGYRTATAWYNAACSYALAAQKLRALGALERSIDAGYDDVVHIQQDDDLDSIRGDSRFQLMIEDLRHSDAGERQSGRAVDRYESLRAEGSENASDWNSVGIELMRSGETDLAIRAFQRRVAIDHNASGIYNQACAEALDGRTSDALATLERAIVAGFSGGRDKLSTDSDLSSLRREAGFRRVLELADELTIDYPSGDQSDPEDWRDALNRARSAAQRHPDLGRAWFNLGFVQIRAGESDEALDSFQRALDKGYRRPTTLYNLGCAAAQVGDADEALHWLGKAEAAGMDMGNLRNDEDLDPLRSDPRFRALLKRVEAAHADNKGKNKS